MAYQETDRSERRKQPRRKDVRGFFLPWTASSIVVAILIGLYAPLAVLDGVAERWVGLVAGAMALLLFTGIGWLVFFVARRPEKRS